MTNYKQEIDYKASLHDRAEGPLGNATELRTPPPLEFVDSDTGEIVFSGKMPEKDSIVRARSLRFKLQNQARKILYGFDGDNVRVNDKGYEVHHRTCSCTRHLSSASVGVFKSVKTQRHFYKGLLTCANARTCPVCAAKINEHKANEMRQAANLASSKGVVFSLMTFTAPHTASDSLDDLIKSVNASLSGFFRGAPAKRFKEKYGIVGYVRSFEVRYGVNGWHPHFHLLMVSKKELPITKRNDHYKPLPIEQQSLEWQWVLSRWQSMCVKHGLNMPNEYGLDIQNGGYAGQYITKFGSDGEILQTQTGKNLTWDVADEVSKGHFKMGRKGSLSPWDLLSGSIDSDSKKQQGFFRQLFLDYARAMKGVTLLKWSRGLRDFFGLKKEKTDEEIIEDDIENAISAAQIPSKIWRVFLRNKKEQRDLLLTIIDNGGFDSLARYLFDFDTSGLSFDDFKNTLVSGGVAESIPQLTEFGNKNYFNTVDISDGSLTFGLSFSVPHVDLLLNELIDYDFRHKPAVLPPQLD